MMYLLPRLRRVVSFVLISIGLLVVLVSATPLTVWWAQRMAGPVYAQTGDVLIVLAGSTVDGLYLGESSYWRSVYAVLAWRQGGFQKVILVGRASHRMPAAEMMRHFLVSHGVPPERIVLETESQNTQENARMVAPLLPTGGKRVLLTSDYHMPRALAVFRRQGIAVEPLPVPDAGKRGSRWQGRWPAFLDLCTETVAWCWYRANHWI